MDGATFVSRKGIEGARAVGDGVKATGSHVVTELEKTLESAVTSASGSVSGQTDLDDLDDLR